MFDQGTLDRTHFSALGSELAQNPDGLVLITQRARLSQIDISFLRSLENGNYKSGYRPVSPTKIRTLRSILGKVLYIGRLTDHVLIFHASFMTTKLPALHYRHLNYLLRLDTKTLQTILFPAPPTKSRLYIETI